VAAVREGVKLLTWEKETFAYADDYDASAKRYRALRAAEAVSMSSDGRGLLVKPQVARQQLDAEAAEGPPSTVTVEGGGGVVGGIDRQPGVKKAPTRFHATVTLDSTRVGRDASRIADEVISHLTGVVGAEVEVVLEIDARIPQGASEQIVRTVTENSRTLKFSSHQFETE
jgi:hypothetical protein